MARKAAEMFAARDIEDYYSKQQIFEMYAAAATSATSGPAWRRLRRLLWQTHPGS